MEKNIAISKNYRNTSRGGSRQKEWDGTYSVEYLRNYKKKELFVLLFVDDECNVLKFGANDINKANKIYNTIISDIRTALKKYKKSDAYNQAFFN